MLHREARALAIRCIEESARTEDDYQIFNRLSYDMVLRKLILAGDFLDFIFDRPETIYELVTDADLLRILKI